MGSARINAIRQRIAVKRSKLPSIGEAWDTLNIGTRERVLNHSGEGGGGIPYKRLMDKDPYRDPHGGKDDFTRIRYVVGDPKKIEVEDINVKKGVDYHYRDGPYFAEYEKRFQKAINTPFNKQSSYLKEAIERGLREQGINHRSEIRPDAPPINLPYGDYGEHETAGMKRDRQRFTKLKQRLGVTGMPKDFGKKRKRFKEDKDIDKLVDDITDVVMKERRKIIKDNSRGGRPRGMRRDLSTPLIKEVPFGPETRGIGQLPHGDPGNYEHIDHRPFTDLTFEEAEAKAKEMGLPTFEDQQGIPKELQDKSKAFHVIPHGGISIPKEQKRKILPFEKRKWEKSKKLRSRSKRYDQREQDAEEIALDLLNDEKPSRLVTKRKYAPGPFGLGIDEDGSDLITNRSQRKIRPPKPVRSDFAEIITAKQKSARVEALRQRMAYDPPEEDILGSDVLEKADAFEIHKQPHNIPPSRLMKKKIHAKDKVGAAFENILGGDDVNQITGEEYKSQLDEIIRKGYIGENVDRTKKYRLDRTNKMPYQRVKDVAQGWTRDYIKKHKLAKEGDYGPSGVKRGPAPGKRFPPLNLTPDGWNKVIDRASKVKDSNIWRERYDAAKGGNTMGFITTDGILYESVGYDANHIGAVREIMEKGKVDPYIYDKFAGNMGPESWMAESQTVRFFDTGKMSMGGGFDEDYTNEHRQLNFQNIEGPGPRGTPTSAQMKTIGSIIGASGLQPSQIVTELGEYGSDRFVRRRLQLHKYPNGDPGAAGLGFLGSKQRIAIKPDGRGPNPFHQNTPYKLPNYSEQDYEAFHDKILDQDMHFDHGLESGIYDDLNDVAAKGGVYKGFKVDENTEFGSDQIQDAWSSPELDSDLPWKNLSDRSRMYFRKYYQKMLSGSADYQTGGRIRGMGDDFELRDSYVKPGFSRNIWQGKKPAPRGTGDIRAYIKDTGNPLYYNQTEWNFGDSDVVSLTKQEYDDPSKYGKSSRIQTARERLGGIKLPNLIEKRLVDYTGKTTKLSGKHFITSKGEITRPLSWHRTTLEESGIAPNVVGKRGMEGFLQKNNVVRIDIGKDYRATGGEGPWLEIEAEHKLTPQQSNIINSHIKKNKLKPTDVMLKDKSTQVKKQLPKGFGLSNEELVNLERQEEQRRTHTQNLAGKLRQRIAVIRVSPTTKRIKRVKKVLDYEYPYQGPEVPTTTYPKTNIPKLTGPRTTTGEERRRKVTKKERKALKKYISKGTKIRPKKRKHNV